MTVLPQPAGELKALPGPHLPATASSVCTTDALPGAPNQIPGYKGAVCHTHITFIIVLA